MQLKLINKNTKHTQIPKAILYSSRPETFLRRNKDSISYKRQHYNILVLKSADVV